jgi:hypothetical protein
MKRLEQVVYGPKMSGRSRHGAPDRKDPEDTIEDTTVVHPWNAARLVRQHRFDGSPLMVGEFVAHDSRLQFASLNHTPCGAINLQRPVMTDNNALLFLPLSGVQPT